MALIARLVVHLLQGAFVVAVNWDMGMGKGILIKQSARSSYAASGIGNLKPVPIVTTTLIVV